MLKWYLRYLKTNYLLFIAIVFGAWLAFFTRGYESLHNNILMTYLLKTADWRDNTFSLSPDIYQYIVSTQVPYPNTHIAHYLSFVEFYAGHLDKASKWFITWSVEDPNNTSPQYFLGEILLQQDDIQGAIAQWQFVQARSPLQALSKSLSASEAKEALSALKALSAIDPNDFASRRAVGDIFMSQGNYDDALRYYLECVAIVPDSPLGYGLVGTAFLEKGDYANAVIYFKQAVAYFPGDPVWIFKGLGESYVGLSNWSEASASFEQAIYYAPFDDSLHLQAAQMYCKQQAPKLALIHYEQIQWPTAEVQIVINYIQQNQACP